MKRLITTTILTCVAAATLAACASNNVVKPATGASTPVAASVPGASKSPSKVTSSKANDLAGYKMVKRCDKTLYCQRELLTGSRTNVSETCLTEEQMEKARRGTLDVVRRMDENAGTSKPATNGFGGQMIGPAVP